MKVKKKVEKLGLKIQKLKRNFNIKQEAPKIKLQIKTKILKEIKNNHKN